MWHNAAASVKIKQKTAEALKAGKRPFKFENGTVVIYAKTQSKAIYDYKQLKREEKVVRKQLKKV